MGLFNDSYDVAHGTMRAKEINDQKKKQEEAEKKANQAAKKSPEQKAKEDNLFI